MLATLNHDAELPLTREDCLDYLGEDGMSYYLAFKDHQRIGQVWSNALYYSGNVSDYTKLIGTVYDPFHHDDWLSVQQALMFLLEN